MLGYFIYLTSILVYEAMSIHSATYEKAIIVTDNTHGMNMSKLI